MTHSHTQRMRMTAFLLKISHLDHPVMAPMHSSELYIVIAIAGTASARRRRDDIAWSRFARSRQRMDEIENCLPESRGS